MMRRSSARLLWGLGCVMLSACGPPATEPATAVDGPEGPVAAMDDHGDAVAEGEAAIKAENYEKAKEVFEGILKERPDHPKANHYLAVALENLGDSSGAETHYRAAIAASPDLTDAALNLSALLIDAQKHEEAARVLESSAERNSKDAALRINLAYARAGMQDIAGAEAAFVEALKIGENPNARLGLAELLLATERADEAMANVDKAVAVASNNVDVLAMSAELYRKAHAAERCVTTYDKAIALEPVAQLYAGRGVCKQMNKDASGAKADFKRAVAVDPSYAPAHFLLGRFLLSVEDDREAAIEAFETCARIAPDSKCAQAAEQARKK